MPSIGSMWSGLRRDLLWAYDARPPSGPYLPFADSGGWFVRQGQAHIRFQNRDYKARNGQWMIPPPQGVQWQSFDPGTHLLSVRFRLCWPDAGALFHPSEPLIVNDSEFPELRNRAERLVSAFATVRGTSEGQHALRSFSVPDLFRMDQAFLGFLVDWSHTLQSSGVQPYVPAPYDARITLAMDLMDRTHRPLKQIASAVSLSLSQLDRLFLRYTGNSPKHHRNQQRLRRVIFALKHSDQPIKTIAYNEGFRRISHFSAWFKTRTGISPQQYRKTYFGSDA